MAQFMTLPTPTHQYVADSQTSCDGVSLLVKACSPLPSTLSLRLPTDSNASSVLYQVANRLCPSSSQSVAKHLRLTQVDGRKVHPSTTLRCLATSSAGCAPTLLQQHPLVLEVRMAFRGGKGGFGSMLRAQGGKMSSNRNGEENNDSCRDLNGRRLSTVKQARQLALYMSNQVEREKEVSDAQKKKYAKLEKMLGRSPKGESDFVEAAQKLHEQGGSLGEDENDDSNDGEGGEAGKGEGSSKMVAAAAAASTAKSPSSSSRPPPVKGSTTDTDLKGKKRERINDTEYIEQSREIVDNVRSAVASAMMKNKKKKTTAKATSSNDSSGKPVAQSPAQTV